MLITMAMTVIHDAPWFPTDCTCSISVKLLVGFLIIERNLGICLRVALNVCRLFVELNWTFKELLYKVAAISLLRYSLCLFLPRIKFLISVTPTYLDCISNLKRTDSVVPFRKDNLIVETRKTVCGIFMLPSRMLLGKIQFPSMPFIMIKIILFKVFRRTSADERGSLSFYINIFQICFNKCE